MYGHWLPRFGHSSSSEPPFPTSAPCYKRVRMHTHTHIYTHPLFWWCKCIPAKCWSVRSEPRGIRATLTFITAWPSKLSPVIKTDSSKYNKQQASSIHDYTDSQVQYSCWLFLHYEAQMKTLTWEEKTLLCAVIGTASHQLLLEVCMMCVVALAMYWKVTKLNWTNVH